MRSPREPSITAATKASSVISMEWNTLVEGGTKRAMRLRFAMSLAARSRHSCRLRDTRQPGIRPCHVYEIVEALVQQEDNRKQCTMRSSRCLRQTHRQRNAERDRDERFQLNRAILSRNTVGLCDQFHRATSPSLQSSICIGRIVLPGCRQ